MQSAQPVIYDTDYGPIIDDVFDLGLLANSGDLLDLKYVLATGENPSLGAQCAAKHLDLANRNDIPVGIGAETRLRTIWRHLCNSRSAWVKG